MRVIGVSVLCRGLVLIVGEASILLPEWRVISCLGRWMLLCDVESDAVRSESHTLCASYEVSTLPVCNLKS